MALRCINFLRIMQNLKNFRHNLITTCVAVHEDSKLRRPKEYKTEKNLIYLEDTDTFGTLSGIFKTYSEKLDDEDDLKEQEYIQNIPLHSQKLTTNQYADLIKQYLKYKRLKEAIDVLEVRMLTEDRVKPENYIYNILIGACAEVGYTKKAFKLYNDMKRRALKATGDTYTCLFDACANSPWSANGLKYAQNLRNLMIEKGIEPNLTNYNAMIKAFGRCGDLATAFQIVDEMKAKKIKIRVHTLNHLLQACISDKDNGLRHGLVVWRKMLQLREKPNIYSFNLILKCVKDCNIGSKEVINELIFMIQQQTALNNKNKPSVNLIECKTQVTEPSNDLNSSDVLDQAQIENKHIYQSPGHSINDVTIINQHNNLTIEFVNKLGKIESNERLVPNLLSKVINMQQVTSLKEIHTPQEKFAIVGGQEDFLKEMETYSVKPDIKTFTQMLPLIDDTIEAENKLLDTIKSFDVKPDIDFYNMLIKKRCLRMDYDAAFDVKKIIKKENEFRKKRYPHSKKLKLNENVMTYGVLAMACKTKETGEQLLNEMKEKQLKVNIETLGTLLRHGTAQSQFGYVLFIIKVVKQENIKMNPIFLKHLETFNDKCLAKIKQMNEKNHRSEVFIKAYDIFSQHYTSWLKNIDIEEVLKPDNPWKQYTENYPDTVQHQNIVIKQPKKYYKKSRKYVRYTPKIID